MNRNPEPSNFQILLIIAIFLSIFSLTIWSFFVAIDWAIAKIPYSVEQKLGAVIVPIYEKQAENSLQQENLNLLLDRLESNLTLNDNPQRDFQILLIPENTVNAIAIPGDTIIIYQGILEEITSENELMMILGHELGHFIHRDHIRRLGRTFAIKLALATFFGDAGTITNMGTGAIEMFTNAKYSQSQELEADEFGLKLLNKTYFHVGGAKDFFERLSKKDAVKWDFLASHPHPKKRLEKLTQLIEKNNYSMGELKPLKI